MRKIFLIILMLCCASPLAASDLQIDFKVVCEELTEDCEAMKVAKTNQELFVKKKPSLTVEDIEKVKSLFVGLDLGTAAVKIQFNEEGKAKLLKVTEENVGRQLAVVVDGEIVIAPSIGEPIVNGVATVILNSTEQASSVIRRFSNQ